MSLQPRSPLRVAALVSGVRSGIRWTAFWIAVALPFLHVPLFIAGDVHAGILLFLVGINVVCLLAGYPYGGVRSR